MTSPRAVLLTLTKAASKGRLRTRSPALPRLWLGAALALITGLFVGCGQPQTPVTHDPGAVVADGQLGTPLLLANGQSTVYARIRISTLPRPEKARGAINVAVAIDTSGSMEGKPIEEARRAALQMMDALKDGDRLAVIAFHSKAEVLLPSTELSAEIRDDVKQRISAMKAQGTTEMAGGLEAAISQVRANYSQKGVNRVVLLGDGIPNNEGSIVYTAQRAAEEGIAVTTLGLGLDYDETLMGKLAQVSGGRFRYIETADKVAAIFQEELSQIDSIYGRNANVRIVAGPGVRIESVVGGPDEAPSQSAYVPLGDIGRGDTRDVVVRMTVTPRKAGVPIELLDATLTFDDALEGGGRLERRVYLGAHTSEEPAAVAKARNPEVELSAALAAASATTLRARGLAQTGAYVRARALLTVGSAAASAQAKRTPSAALIKHADDMVAVAKDMPTADKMAPAATSYDFQDDQLRSPEAPAPSPSVAQKRKEAHSDAMQVLGH